MAAGDVNVAFTKVKALSCAMFDGVDDYISYSGGISSVGVGAPFSISFWIYPNLSYDGTIFFNTYSATSRFGCGLRNDETIDAGLHNGTDYISLVASNSSSVNLRTWNNVIITYNGITTGNIYINGVDEKAGTGNYGYRTGNYLVIGGKEDGTNCFNGSISNLCIWDRVLTSTEITQVATGNIIPNGLVHRYKLDGDATDSVGTADGTLTGATFGIVEDTVAAAIKAQRVTANDKYLLCSGIKGQVYHTAIEEAP